MRVISLREPTEAEKELIKKNVKSFNIGSYILVIAIFFATLVFAGGLILVIIADFDNIIDKTLGILFTLIGLIILLYSSKVTILYLRKKSKTEPESQIKIEKIKGSIVAKFSGGKGAHWKLYSGDNNLYLCNYNWLDTLVSLYKTKPKTELELEIFRIPERKTLNFNLYNNQCVVLSIFECNGLTQIEKRIMKSYSILLGIIAILVIFLLLFTWTGVLKTYFNLFMVQLQILSACSLGVVMQLV
ncbi:MAG: hypothetical protein IPO21_12635 [Bacteroidales bacterium]|nr:hypothetical protein [Bacteroidales bacterium]